MDHNIFWSEIVLAVDGVILLYFSLQYWFAKKLYSTYLETLNKGINTVNISDINEQTPTYAVVRGQVKSIGPPIRSLNKPSVSGVIQDLTIKEHATQKTSYGLWLNRQDIIDKKINVVPFELKHGKFKISVTSPKEACYLNLEIIDDHFEPSVSGILGLLFGFQRKGFQFSEYLLKEDSVLTGFGEVIVEKSKTFQLQLIPPRGMSYILTTMDPETLSSQLKSDKKMLGIVTSILGIVGVTVAGLLLWKWWQIERQRRHLKNLKLRALAEKMRNNGRPELNDDSFVCIICLIEPRQVILLPCGHISMCLQCSEQMINQPCPVCRQEVTDINLIFIS